MTKCTCSRKYTEIFSDKVAQYLRLSPNGSKIICDHNVCVYVAGERENNKANGQNKQLVNLVKGYVGLELPVCLLPFL